MPATDARLTRRYADELDHIRAVAKAVVRAQLGFVGVGQARVGLHVLTPEQRTEGRTGQAHHGGLHEVDREHLRARRAATGVGARRDG